MLTLIRTALLAITLVLAGAWLSPAAAEVDTIWDRRDDGSNGAGSGGPHKWGDLRTWVAAG
jgi:hypothetical protein